MILEREKKSSYASSSEMERASGRGTKSYWRDKLGGPDRVPSEMRGLRWAQMRRGMAMAMSKGVENGADGTVMISDGRYVAA